MCIYAFLMFSRIYAASCSLSNSRYNLSRICPRSGKMEFEVWGVGPYGVISMSNLNHPSTRSSLLIHKYANFVKGVSAHHSVCPRNGGNAVLSCQNVIFESQRHLTSSKRRTEYQWHLRTTQGFISHLISAAQSVGSGRATHTLLAHTTQ